MPFCNHRLNILSWNIQGLKHSLYDKTKDPLFQNEISNCQIVALTETHMTEDEDINIPGFRLLTKGCRNKKSDKGGTAIFIRHDLKKYVQVVGEKNPDILWCVLPKKHFGVNKDIFVCCCYSSPRDSKWIERNEDPFDTLDRDIAKYSDIGYIILTGDLNVRIGHKNELTSNKYGITNRNSMDTKSRDGGLLLDI